VTAITWQKLRSFGVLTISLLILAIAVGTMHSCSGGGGDVILPPPETNDEQQGITNRPIISSISPAVASAGQDVTITGFYFGAEEGTSSLVTIGGRQFTVKTWSDQLIEATVPANATSGIVVVTVGTLSSRSGISAQLFIGTAPPSGEPLIIALSHDTASIGSRVTVFGFNFGATQGDSRVTFAGAEGGRIAAQVVTETINGTTRSHWTNTSIQVIVPVSSTTGPVMVTVGQMNSNANFNFIPLPPPPDLGNAPSVTSLSPEHGPAGTALTISGDNFGYSRGISVVSIGGIPLQIVAWSNDQIVAVIPENAATNLIRVLVGGVVAESPHVFVVEMVPFLTSLQPNILQVGSELRISGRNFGQDKGSIRLTPTGSATSGQSATTISGNDITTWTDTEVVVTSLPEINSDADIPVEVTLLSGASPPLQSGNSITVNVYSPVEATLTVDRPAGVANAQPPFKFTVGVGGGTPPYKVEFIFGDTSAPSAPVSTFTSATIEHIYSAAGTFTPSARVTDDNGSRRTVTGNPILVVAPGQPVIYDVRVETLGTSFPNNASFKANNEVAVYFGSYQNSVYNFDETFVPVLSQVGLDFMSYAKRQEGLFAAQDIEGVKVGGRPYAYRFGGGSVINIFGYNLNAGLPGAGHILKLDYEDPLGFYPINNGSPNIFAWSDEAIQFKVPNVTNQLGGIFGITFDPASGIADIKSPKALVAAPMLSGYTPNTVDMHTEISINLNDAVPPIVDSSYIGTKAYLFLTFPAQDATTNAPYNYDRNGDGSNDNYLLPGGIPITLLPEQKTITLDLSNISDGGPYAARDAASTNVQAVMPRAGNWKVFLWVGVKASPFADSFANTGIVSNDLTIINVTT
jgi:hypothetical protein